MIVYQVRWLHMRVLRLSNKFATRREAEEVKQTILDWLRAPGAPHGPITEAAVVAVYEPGPPAMEAFDELALLNTDNGGESGSA